MIHASRSGRLHGRGAGERVGLCLPIEELFAWSAGGRPGKARLVAQHHPDSDTVLASLRERVLRSALRKLEGEKGRLDDVAGRIARLEIDPWSIADELARGLR